MLWLPSESNHCPLTDKIICIHDKRGIRTARLASNNDGQCCTVGRLLDQSCSTWKAFKDSSIPLSCSQGSKEVLALRDIPTQGKQLDQQSKTTNRRKEDPAEPCSREVEEKASMARAGAKTPPRGRESSRDAYPRCDGDSTNSFATGSHRKADCFHSSPRAKMGSRLAQSKWGLSSYQRLASAPPLCIHVQS